MSRPDLSESDKAMERVVKGLVPLVVVVVAGLLIFGTDDDADDRSESAEVTDASRNAAVDTPADDRALGKASFETSAAVAQPRPSAPARTTTSEPRARAVPAPKQRAAPAPTQVASRTPVAVPLSAPERRYVSANKLNIRAAPKSGEVVARARKGDRVKVYAVLDGWARVSSGNKPPRWVSEGLLTKTRPPVYYRVITDILKVRTTPAKGKIVATARRGDRVRVYAMEKRWARISPDGRPGRWISADYLSRTKLPADFYVDTKVLNLRAAPKSGKVVGRVERGAAVKVYSVRDGWGRVTKTKSKARWASLEYLTQSRTFE